jgi:hypothetical protein
MPGVPGELWVAPLLDSCGLPGSALQAEESTHPAAMRPNRGDGPLLDSHHAPSAATSILTPSLCQPLTPTMKSTPQSTPNPLLNSTHVHDDADVLLICPRQQ